MTILDVHNKNRTEAHILVTSFIKERYEMRDYVVLVSHGYGEFVLKDVVHGICKKSKYVESYELAPPRLGGGGVTQITLKKKKRNYSR